MEELKLQSPRQNEQPTHSTWDDLSESGNYATGATAAHQLFRLKPTCKEIELGVTASFYKAFKRRFEYFRRHTATFQWTTSATQPHDDKWQRTKKKHWANRMGISV